MTTSDLFKLLLVWAIASLLFFAMVSEAFAIPVTWNHPDPADDRVTHYEIHCLPVPQVLQLDGSEIVDTVPDTQNTTDLTGKIAVGFNWDCVATSYSETYKLRSAGSNNLVIPLSPLSAPTTFTLVGDITIQGTLRVVPNP